MGAKFERNIPIPGRYGPTGHRPGSIPDILAKLMLEPSGTSVFIQGKTASAIANNGRNIGLTKKDITSRSVVENGVAGVRVWNIRPAAKLVARK